MKVAFSDQYQVPCIVLDETDVEELSASDLLEQAEADEAICMPDGEDEIHYVIQFPNRPMELYTQSALERSFA